MVPNHHPSCGAVLHRWDRNHWGRTGSRGGQGTQTEATFIKFSVEFETQKLSTRGIKIASGYHCKSSIFLVILVLLSIPHSDSYCLKIMLNAPQRRFVMYRSRSGILSAVEMTRSILPGKQLRHNLKNLLHKYRASPTIRHLRPQYKHSRFEILSGSTNVEILGT